MWPNTPAEFCDLAKTPENGPTGRFLAAPRRPTGMTFFWGCCSTLWPRIGTPVSLGARDDRRGHDCFFGILFCDAVSSGLSWAGAGIVFGRRSAMNYCGPQEPQSIALSILRNEALTLCLGMTLAFDLAAF